MMAIFIETERRSRNGDLRWLRAHAAHPILNTLRSNRAASSGVLGLVAP
jgi:hypothetical protein